jgi:NADH:ubiquinone oxidoreductase subunit F (NADH-binding)
MTLPRLLMGADVEPMSLERHRDHRGDLPLTGSRLADEIAGAGLRGRGGAGFPLSLKLNAVRRGRRTPVVVVNGCEGEPMSAKDRLLLCSLPHLVLDGAFAVAGAIGTSEVIVAVDELDPRAQDTIKWALAQRQELRRGRLRAEVVAVPGGYVSGQESAVVQWLNDGVAKPMARTPRVSERGVKRRPTLVSNVETLAHVALIARYGARWFREVGTHEDPGSALVTVSGAVVRPGVYEVAHGSALGSVVTAAGGLSEPTRAFLVGGYAGGWLGMSQARQARLSRTGLAPFGVGLGAGIIVALPERSCPVAEATRVAGWLADHSAGQCGPCVNGLAAVAEALAAVCHGNGGPGLSWIDRWCDQIAGRGACAHPDGTASFVSSAIRVFANELADHARHGLCDACTAPPILATPRPQLLAAR